MKQPTLPVDGTTLLSHDARNRPVRPYVRSEVTDIRRTFAAFTTPQPKPKRAPKLVAAR